jgi:hypothetical protein
MYYNKRVPTICKEGEKMSLVRYTNKKTGVVTVYESTSHYDPVTKQSRPIRKYLGVEDPETGKIIPSSGKPGRKKATESAGRPAVKKEGIDYKLLYEKEKKESADKDARIKALERRNKLLVANLEHMQETISKALSVVDPNI